MSATSDGEMLHRHNDTKTIPLELGVKTIDMKVLRLFAVVCLGATLMACDGNNTKDEKQQFEQIANKPADQIQKGDIDEILEYYEDLTEKFVENVKEEKAQVAQEVSGQITKVYGVILKYKSKFTAEQNEKLSEINKEFKKDFGESIEGKSDEFKAKMKDQCENIKNSMENLGDQLKEGFNDATDKAEELGNDAANSIKDGANDVKDKAKDLFKKK